MTIIELYRSREETSNNMRYFIIDEDLSEVFRGLCPTMRFVRRFEASEEHINKIASMLKDYSGSKERLTARIEKIVNS